MKKLVPKNPKMQAETIRRRRATGPKGSPSLIKDANLDERPGFCGFSDAGTGGAAGGFSTATPPDFLSSLSLEFGIQSSTGQTNPQASSAFTRSLTTYFYIKCEENVKKANREKKGGRILLKKNLLSRNRRWARWA
jgi:hypothetical protein